MMPPLHSNHSKEANQLRWGFVLAIGGLGAATLFLAWLALGKWTNEELPTGAFSRQVNPPHVKTRAPVARAVVVDEAQKVSTPVKSSTPVLQITNAQPGSAVAEPNLAGAETGALGLRQRPEIPPAPAGSAGGVPVSMGKVSGFVLLDGIPPRERQIQMDAFCGRFHPKPVTTRHFVVGTNGGLANVVVYVKDGLTRSSALPPPPEDPVLDQIDCMYQPYVMAVVTGQLFKIRNSDPFLHNVHATPKVNAEFNLGQPTRGQNHKSFFTPEMFIRIKCDVHNWMFAYVSVLDHPIFAVTDKNGFFELPGNLSARRYTLAATHQRLGEITQPLMVDYDNTNFALFRFKAPPR